MEILFVSSGNSGFGISPIIKNQGQSLERQGIIVKYYGINGKGLLGYIKNIRPLKRFLHSQQFDLIHAHFSLTAFVVALSGAKPLIVSLMGWNVRLLRYKIFIHIFNFLFFDACIVKSQLMKDYLGIKDLIVIPNGIDFSKFKPFEKIYAQKMLNWDRTKKHILFAARPDRPIKNFLLAKQAYKILIKQYKGIELHVLNNVPNDQMSLFYSACDVVLLTSKAEGSPNVIKEAMACNCPIVTTDVGDVREYLVGVEGCYICNNNAFEIAEKLKLALLSCQRTNGREKIKHLDSNIIAFNIIEVYNKVISNEY